MSDYDAIIIGSGPNGLAAAICLAREGYRVQVVEAYDRPGGGMRTEEGTLPGFQHDVCSAVFPLAQCSPFFQSIDLEAHGLEWIQPDIPLAHPFDDGTAVAMYRSVEETAAQFGARDARAYRRLFEPLLAHGEGLIQDLLQVPQIPSHLLGTMQFGLRTLPPATWLGRLGFSDERARGLWAGNAAHSILPLNQPLATGAIGLMLMFAGHQLGWPIAKGGAGAITQALCDCLEQLGGEIVCGQKVSSLDELPDARVYLFDTTPSAMADIAGDRLGRGFRRRLDRFRHGAGVFKIDYALSEPVPWTAAECRQAGTVHLGGTMDEIAASEAAACRGQIAERPFVLSAQQSRFDPTRAPEGQHTFWAYCHVPSGSDVDMTAAIEAQIERFAPGFGDVVLKRQVRNCSDFQRYNANYIGGDIAGGATDWRQLLTRPVARLDAHTTPSPEIYLASASTPPGGGIHGMCGYLAAKAAMRQLSK